MAASWWVVLEGRSVISQILGALTPGGLLDPTQNATVAVVVQSASKPANYYKGPYGTQAEAQAQAQAYNAPSAGSEAEQIFNTGPASGSGQSPSWNLIFGNTTGLLGRIIKVVIGGVLLISGIIHLTGAESKVSQITSKIPVVLPV